MTDYVKQNNTDVVALFLTDGYPNEGTPSEVAQYTVLKDKYPFLTINGVQYEMGKDVIDEITNISDNQFVANRDTLNNVLIEAGLNPEVYEKFIIEDYINTDYFNITSTDDIKTSIGTATIEDTSGEKKIVWNLGDNSYVTGSNKTMTIDLILNNTIPSDKTFYPTNTKEVITYKLDGEEIIKSSTDTPVLTNKYSVIYDTNTPDGCVIENNIDSDEYLVYSTVSKSTNQLTCSGYHFRGWTISDEDDSDITKINEDLFIMPGHNVTVRAEWSNQSISKSVNGVVNSHTTLYKVLKEEAENNGLAKEYTGEHHDSFTENPSQKIYHWYADNPTDGLAVRDKNNVIFAGHCWEMIRTTDTGGVKMIYNGEAIDNQCLSTRGYHNVGYAGITKQTLNSSYWYGTDYTYDSANKVFTLSGTREQTTWSDSTSVNLIGKYTCKSATETATCSTLYLIESYNSVTAAYVISLNSESHYSQFGKLEFNHHVNSPTYVGYKYGDVYSYSKTFVTDTQSFTSTEKMLESSTIRTTYWYSDSITYNSSTGMYSLDNPYQISSTADYPNLVGKYTFRNSTQTYTESVVYYIAGVNESTIYYKYLRNGNLLSNYEPIIFGDSITDNGDGTYTINNTTAVTLSGWYTNFASYKNKYTCIDSSNTCANPIYTTATSSIDYTYIKVNEKIVIGKTRSGLTLTDTLLVRKDELVINSDYYSDYKYTCNTDNAVCTEDTLRNIITYSETGYKYAFNYYWGSSVTWDGTNYTLVDPIESFNNLNDISTHHFICLNYGEKKCSTVGYVYYYLGGGPIYYITLKNGVTTIQKIMEDMFTKNTTNSTIKIGIDAWYKHYLLEDYDDYIEDIIFCNERSIGSLNGWNDSGGLTNRGLFFKENSVTIDLSCTNNTDKFSTSNTDALLDYKVGLMSLSDMNILNQIYARRTEHLYWLGSPGYFFDSGASVYYVYSGGFIEDKEVDYNLGVRPSISLRPGIEYISGDGSMEHPYIVDTSE